MNETRKDIIEIIEPYMDKSLSEGCWIEFKDLIQPFSDFIRQITFINGSNIYLNGATGRAFSDYQLKGQKILGHYSITAVLKYIDLNSGTSEYAKKWEDKEGRGKYFTVLESEIDIKDIEFKIIGTNLSNCWDSSDDETLHIFKIPNKPLHLYTEQEDTDLLKLLKQLGK